MVKHDRNCECVSRSLLHFLQSFSFTLCVEEALQKKPQPLPCFSWELRTRSFICLHPQFTLNLIQAISSLISFAGWRFWLSQFVREGSGHYG